MDSCSAPTWWWFISLDSRRQHYSCPLLEICRLSMFILNLIYNFHFYLNWKLYNLYIYRRTYYLPFPVVEILLTIHRIFRIHSNLTELDDDWNTASAWLSYSSQTSSCHSPPLSTCSRYYVSSTDSFQPRFIALRL